MCGVTRRQLSHVPHDSLSPRNCYRAFGSSTVHVAVDTYETDRMLAFVFKCLAVMWGGAAVIHCTSLFGVEFF
jgi:hypothetical protein